ncbi:MAG: ribosome small subunit-dependent GTPase A [Spirochaetae bacterium HGW-Spirochaetae-7]|jgi:ribosome biogenesis GTPase|nr:MAG: ribosome small subunit-dependent GTPase A [Spirochaetae bacterium HGW-Spirochaetae-7]
MEFLNDTEGSPEREGVDPLLDLGWNQFFSNGLSDLRGRGRGDAELEPARVLEVRRGSFVVAARDGNGGLAEFEARPSGRLSSDCLAAAQWPATGDWVALRGRERTGGRASADPGSAIVEAVLPRSSAFSRKAAGDSRYDKVSEQVLVANVDTAFIVTAAGTDFSVRRIERYAALAHESGASPVLVITKADLAGDAVLDLVAAAGDAYPFAPAFAVCAPEGRGLDAMAKHLKAGSTAVLLGSSGSGKSTLLNALAGTELNSTGAVKDYDQRGRHTTSSRTLFMLPGGAMVIDTPGLREVQLWLGEESLGGVFTEIEEAAAACRFSDCSHEGEPDCAVQAGLESGSIMADRYESWQRLMKEVRFLETKTNVTAKLAERAKWKIRSKASRQLRRLRGEI